ncbi:uncharacterized protein LOC123531843 isoform X2 [Mercenaria mercenaria]|uniref:uncharacterized protein LOC123531843 isoform X2 n=1 Tax=Mercenaria mercenaria TaxID=6596 RepID=UPI00234E55C4|nr:uncharacterized protein LOC123531843 isoform X2 [Mercenaria mercenaria]
MLSITLQTIVILTTPCVAIKSKFRILDDKITVAEKTLGSEMNLIKNELSDLRSELEVEKDKIANIHSGPAVDQDCSCYNDIRHIRELLLQQDLRHRFVVDQINSLREENDRMKQKFKERQTAATQKTVNVGDLDSQLEDFIQRSKNLAKKNKKRIGRLQKATENHLLDIKKAFKNEKVARWNNSRHIAMINKTLFRDRNTVARPGIYVDIDRLKEKDKLFITKVSTLTQQIKKLKKVCKAAINRP